MKPTKIMRVAHLDDWARALLDWQQQYGRHALPWQKTNDPYCIWVSEVMLQQTQVSTVLHYYQRFLKAFPTIEKLANAPIDSVLQYWAGLGYYRRAHHLHQAAQQILKWSRREYPIDAASWQRLPGIGRSTAASIVASAFGVAAGILDGNVRRVLARYWLGVSSTSSLSSQQVERLWEISEMLMTQTLACKMPRRWNQALMDIGAMVCARRPLCATCPLKDHCRTQKVLRTKTATEIESLFNPNVKNKLSSVKHKCSITRSNIISQKIRMLIFYRYQTKRKTPIVQFWLEKRLNKGLWAGLWSFPLLMPATLTRPSVKHWPRLSAEIYQMAMTIKKLPTFEHKLTHRYFQVQPILIEGITESRVIQSLLKSEENIEGEWLSYQLLHKKGMPVLAQKAVRCMIKLGFADNL